MYNKKFILNFKLYFVGIFLFKEIREYDLFFVYFYINYILNSFGEVELLILFYDTVGGNVFFEGDILY